MARYLIAYDIGQPRRLARMQRFLSQRALRVQYSLYLVELDPRALTRLWESLCQRIDPAVDDLRCYPLPCRGLVWSIGRSQCPPGVFFAGTL